MAAVVAVERSSAEFWHWKAREGRLERATSEDFWSCDDVQLPSYADISNAQAELELVAWCALAVLRAVWDLAVERHCADVKRELKRRRDSEELAISKQVSSRCHT